MEETGVLENLTLLSLVLPDFEPGQISRIAEFFSQELPKIYNDFFAKLVIFAERYSKKRAKLITDTICASAARPFSIGLSHTDDCRRCAQPLHLCHILEWKLASDIAGFACRGQAARWSRSTAQGLAHK
jgi:hypothetical protein